MFKVKNTTTEKPKGLRNGGRKENPEWAELAKAISALKPNTWNVFEGMDGTTEAYRIGTHLNQKASFAEGRALHPLAGKVKVSLTQKATNKAGKKTAHLAIMYVPEGVKPKKAAPKVTKKTAASKETAASK